MKRKKIREDSISGRSVTLTFPMPPNLANGRMHWRTKHRRKMDYWAALDGGVLRGVFAPQLEKPLGPSVMTAEMVLWAGMDQDNSVARFKWILDWLVTRGYLSGDSRKQLRWAAFPSQRIDRKQPAHIVLTLEEV